MEDNKQDLSPEDTTTEDLSTPETEETDQTPDSEATEEKAAGKGVPFSEHPEWKKFQERKEKETEEAKELANQERARANHLQSEILKITGNLTSKEEAEEKLFEANTPEEKQFWTSVVRIADKIADKKISKEKETLVKKYEQRDAYRDRIVGGMVAKEFLKSHKDLDKDSPEMKTITQKAYSMWRVDPENIDLSDALDDAYKVVMFDKTAQRAAEKEREKTKQKNQDKLKANLEQKTIPESVLKNTEFQNTDEAMREAEKELDFKW